MRKKKKNGHDFFLQPESSTEYIYATKPVKALTSPITLHPEYQFLLCKLLNYWGPPFFTSFFSKAQFLLHPDNLINKNHLLMQKKKKVELQI